MQRNPSSLVLLGLLSLFVPGLARAADVAVFPVETTSVSELDADVMGELLAQAYAATSRRAVLAPSRTEGALAQSASYQEAAVKLGVAEYLRTNAVSVGRRLVLQVVRHDASGRAVFAETMTADSIEDVPTVCQRLALAVEQRVPDQEVRTYRNVTLTETRPQNRVWTEKLWGVKAGVHMPFARNADYAAAASLGVDFRLEHELFFLEFGASVIIATDFDDGYHDCSGTWNQDTPECQAQKRKNHGSVGGLAAEIGASRFVNPDDDVAVYVGGGLSPRLGMEQENVMVFVYGQLGVMMPRDASTRFYADLRLSQSLAPSELDNGKKRYPTEPTLLVGVAW
jgi:hypothetical protein